jgi:hypothetical protein
VSLEETLESMDREINRAIAYLQRDSRSKAIVTLCMWLGLDRLKETNDFWAESMDQPPKLCNICGRRMYESNVPSRDCGGDCLQCMAESGDPDCIDSMIKWLESLR